MARCFSDLHFICPSGLPVVVVGGTSRLESDSAALLIFLRLSPFPDLGLHSVFPAFGPNLERNWGNFLKLQPSALTAQRESLPCRALLQNASAGIQRRRW